MVAVKICTKEYDPVCASADGYKFEYGNMCQFESNKEYNNKLRKYILIAFCYKRNYFLIVLGLLHRGNCESADTYVFKK